MGPLSAIRGKRIYLDTNIFIFIAEGSAEYRASLEALFDLTERGETHAVTSELTLAEALAKPYELGRQDLIEVYERMISSSAWLTVQPVDRRILADAARLRGELRLKLPDAIHAATALIARCGLLLTNDRHFRSLPEGIERITISRSEDR